MRLRQPCIVAASLDAGDTDGQIYLAASVSPAALREHLAEHIKVEEIVRWDEQQQAVVARREERFGALLLEAKPLTRPNADKQRAAMLEGVRRLGIEALPWTSEARQWRARLQCLHAWTPPHRDVPVSRETGSRERPEENWPDVSDTALLANLETWLGPYLDGITRRDHLARLDVLSALKSLLDWNQAKRLEENAPTHLTVPSGSHLRLEYELGKPPVLAVKLQEMFGCADTPRVGGGQDRGDTASVVAGEAADTGDAGPAWFLGAHLCGSKEGTQGALPQTPVAGRPEKRAAHRAREAAIFLSRFNSLVGGGCGTQCSARRDGNKRRSGTGQSGQ